MKKSIIFPMLSLLLILNACQSGNKSDKNANGSTYDSLFATIKIKKEDFNTIIDDKKVASFVLKNKHNATAVFTNYGGISVGLA